jgi:hypothetical protein
MSGACGARGEIRNAYKMLVGKPEGKTPLPIDIMGRKYYKWILWD